MLIGVALALALVGTVLVALGWITVRPAAALVARPTTTIGSLEPGPVEVAGVLRARGTSALSSGPRPACLVVHTIREERVGKKSYREVGREAVAVEAELHDETGSCAVSLEHVELLGETWERYTDGRKTRRTETLIPDGASVLVSGEAVEMADPSTGGFRSYGRALRLQGREESPLRVAMGGQARAIWVFGWRALVIFLCGLGVFALAAAALWLSLRLDALAG